MDIYDDEALKRPPPLPAIVKRLPTELVHQILDELSLRRILQILIHKDPYLDRCIMSHINWGILFGDQVDIDWVLPLFMIHTEMNRFFRTKTTLDEAPQRDLDLLLAHRSTSTFFRSQAGNLKSHLTATIKSALPQTEREMNILEPHATMPYPGHNADLTDRWEWFKTTKRNLNQAKSRQLLVVADLMQRFPEKIMLKKPLDPSQGPPRKNLKHIESQFRNAAMKALQHTTIVYPPHGFTYSCKYTIELLPYNRYLWLFFKIIRKYPVAEPYHIDELVANLTINSASREPDVSVYDYPSEISADIKMILEGLKFVYTGNPLLVVRRLRWESWPTISGPNSSKPIFNSKEFQHHWATPIEGHSCGVSNVTTHDEREYKWLRAFLNVVTWMEKEFEKAEEAAELPVEKQEVVESKSRKPLHDGRYAWNSAQPNNFANAP